jgi:hypothetical protein
MFVPGITFTSARPIDTGLTSRADVAMFVGCVGRRDTPVPSDLRALLAHGGFSPDGLFKASQERVDALLDLPVPVESWSQFDALFAWDRRPAAPGSSDFVPCPLGLAVRSFFEEGGAKAYVVRTGDPLPLADPENADELATSKLRLLSWSQAAPAPDAGARAPILPGLGGAGRTADAGDPRSWSGAALCYAVDDAAMLLLPDLIDICAGSPLPVPPIPEPPGPPEQFKPCATVAPGIEPEPRLARPEYRAPRLDAAGYGLWARALRFALDLLGRPRGPAHRRDVMLISAFPLPLVESGLDRGEENWPLALLNLEGIAGSGLRLLDEAAIGSARLQLAYPWVETAASKALPEGLQSPEGLLAGLVARTSLADGGFRSAAGRPCRSVRRLFPVIAGSDVVRGLPGGKADWLGARLSLLGQKRGRFELLSDSTMAESRAWRPGGVSRLMAILLRAARLFGDDLLFEPSGPALWARIQGKVENFLERLWRDGALSGASPAAAFAVICDASSMTQADIDAGRVVCRISFTAAHPIERITVSLLLLEAPSSLREAA